MIPRYLQQRLQRGHVIPFVGAGVSMAVRRADDSALFPSWKQLLLDGAERLDDEAKPKDAVLVRALLDVDDADYLEAARRLRRALGSHWSDFLKRHLDVPRDAVDDATLRLARAVWGLGNGLVITTNYDNVLRWACPDERQLNFWDVKAPAEQAAYLRDEDVGTTIWHLHGRVGNAADVILTPDGYRRLYAPNNDETQYQAAVTTLRNLLLTRTLLFVGFSLDDEHLGVELQSILDVFEDNATTHYALIHEGHAARLRERQPGVKIITFEDYGKPLAELVEELGRIASATPETNTEPEGVNTVTAQEMFLVSYRNRMFDQFSRWKISVAIDQPGSEARPIEAALDEMYVPLRLRSDDLGKDSVIEPVHIISRSRPLVVRGSGGSGKTTWMRWTFRRLLNMNTALPIMLSLREMASAWSLPLYGGQGPPLDKFLETWMTSSTGGDWSLTHLKEILTSESGPRPVLLVDGWDELGQLGEKFRARLIGFMKEYPRVLVIVSSRPYGESRPSSSDGFEIFDIQPLSDLEIEDFTYRFFAQVYNDDYHAMRESNNFTASLDLSPEAKALARTILLLNMMLAISRSGPLPEKRHELYHSCVENLLMRIPDKKMLEGAQLQANQWAPSSGPERMRIAALLAFTMQNTGYISRGRSLIALPWAEVLDMLPEDLDASQKQGFLTWLTDSAGILGDRTDGRVSFVHLSFQEYLSAYHITFLINSQTDSSALKSLVKRGQWWETLTLWIALAKSADSASVDNAILNLNLTKVEDVVFSGVVLANGLGSMDLLSNWIDHLFGIFQLNWNEALEVCSHAWSSSTQGDRRKFVREKFSEKVKNLDWLGWLHASAFYVAVFSEPLVTPYGILGHTRAKRMLVHPAYGRAFCGFCPYWPMQPTEVALLQLWQGHRQIAGHRLSGALASGAARDDICRIAEHIALPLEFNKRTRDACRVFSRSVNQEHAMSRSIGQRLAVAWYAYWNGLWPDHRFKRWAVQWTHRIVKLLTDHFPAALINNAKVYNWQRDFAISQNDRHAQDWVSRNAASRMAEKLARDWHLDGDWLEKFIYFDVHIVGHVVAIPFFSSTSRGLGFSPAAKILSRGCSVNVEDNAENLDNFEAALRLYEDGTDPLWPALARYLARRSTPDDRALLEDLARHPEKRDPPLSWGLQYIVRGDVIDNDGNVLRLDDLCDELGLPRLPYLEDMPDELDVDWDAD